MTLKNIDFEIKVVNKQRIDDNTDTICEEAKGKFSIKNSKAYILYKTTEEGVETTTTITVEGDCVSVKRSSNTTSLIVLDRTKKTEFKYNTMYGVIDVTADTKRIVNALSEEGGKLRLIYTLIMQGTKIENDMEIAVWRKSNEDD